MAQTSQEKKRMRRGAVHLALVAFACAACGEDTTSALQARQDGGLDASSASGGVNTAGSGGAGNRAGTGGASGRATGGSAGLGSGGSAGLGSGGSAGLGNGGSAGLGSGGSAGLGSGGSAGLGSGGSAGVEAGAGGGSSGGDGGDCASAVDQMPCSNPGASCGGPCTDVCSFCNVLVCTGGRWQRREAFPAPCFDCGSRRCQTGATFCSVIHAATDSFECIAVPVACRRDVTCGCIQPEVSADSCTSPNQGEVTVERSGG